MSVAHDDVMRAEYAGNRCNPGSMVKWSPYGYAGSVLVQPDTLKAWQALDVQMRAHEYTFDDPIAGGTYNCRKVAGSSKWSLHAYGIAYDINPKRNPRQSPLKTDLPAKLIADILAIKTKTSGTVVFEWGGHWSKPDAMHFQVRATKKQLAEGLTFPNEGADDMFVKVGDENAVVEYWQRRLKRLDASLLPKWGIDGDYGPEVTAGVKKLVPDSDGLQIGPYEAEHLDALVASLPAAPKAHKHGSGTLAIGSLDEKTITGKTGLGGG